MLWARLSRKNFNIVPSHALVQTPSLAVSGALNHVPTLSVRVAAYLPSDVISGVLIQLRASGHQPPRRS